MQIRKMSDTPRNQLQNTSNLSHVSPSQYPWPEGGNYTASIKPTEWLTEHLNITLSDALLSEGDIRPLACAAWAIVLAQYTGRNDASFGIILHGKDDESSVKACTVDCESTLTVSDLVTRVKDQAKETPMCRDVGAFRNHLAFTLRPASEIVEADHLPLLPPDGTVLIFWITLNENCVSLRSDYNPQAVSRAEIRRVMGHFSQVSSWLYISSITHR